MYIYTKNRTNGQPQLPFVCCKWKMETVNLCVFAANGNGKQKFVFLCQQTVNGNWWLLFQQWCPLCLYPIFRLTFVLAMCPTHFLPFDHILQSIRIFHQYNLLYRTSSFSSSIYRAHIFIRAIATHLSCSPVSIRPSTPHLFSNSLFPILIKDIWSFYPIFFTHTPLSHLSTKPEHKKQWGDAMKCKTLHRFNFFASVKCFIALLL